MDAGTGRLINIKERPAAPQHAGQLRYLSHAIMLEERPPPRLLRAIIYALALLLIALIAWAAVTPVTTVANTRGEVIPAGRVRQIQHLEGGIVAEILVEESDLVEAGEPVLRIDDTVSRAEQDQIRARMAGLSLRIARLRALLSGDPFDASDWAESHPELVADEAAVLDAARAAVDGQRNLLLSRIALSESEIDLRQEEMAGVAGEVAVLEEQYALRADAMARGVGTRVAMLDAERSLAEARGRAAAARVGVDQAALSLAEAQQQLAEFEATQRSELTEQLSQANVEYAEVRETIREFDDRVRRSDVVSPLRGIVNALAVNSIGAVVEPGQPLMEIVPVDETVIVQTQIPPSDIGFVHVGQSVTVLIDGFDVSRYGSITGTVETISANTFTNEDGVPYYRGRVALENDHVLVDGTAQAIMPGMAVTADIEIGSQTILAYLARPVYVGLRAAFSER